MGKEVRFSEVLRRECEGDGPAAVASFDSWQQLTADYPEVAEALEADAENRRMKREDALKMARGALVAIVGEPKEPKAEKKQAAPEKQQAPAPAK